MAPGGGRRALAGARFPRRRTRLRGPARGPGPAGRSAGLLRHAASGAEDDRHLRTEETRVTDLTQMQSDLCEKSETDYSDLSAFFINCTLKRSPEVSNTQGLMDISMEIMRRNRVAVECVRAVDHQIATGVWPDMTEHGWERDEWPEIFEKVMKADILVLGMSIWLGEKSSVATQIVERLYGNSHLLNDEGQYAYYGRV